MNSDSRISLTLPLILIAIIGVLHFLGFYLQLYWRIMWYDRVVHTLGGIWVVLMLFFILSIFHFSFSKKTFLITGILASVIVGIMWELFELKSGITVFTDHGYALDTIGDIISDFVGGIIGCIYSINYWKTSTWSNQK